jgi:hypothetical protein
MAGTGTDCLTRQTASRSGIKFTGLTQQIDCGCDWIGTAARLVLREE